MAVVSGVRKRSLIQTTHTCLRMRLGLGTGTIRSMRSGKIMAPGMCSSQSEQALGVLPRLLQPLEIVLIRSGLRATTLSEENGTSSTTTMRRTRYYCYMERLETGARAGSYTYLRGTLL